MAKILIVSVASGKELGTNVIAANVNIEGAGIALEWELENPSQKGKKPDDVSRVHIPPVESLEDAAKLIGAFKPKGREPKFDKIIIIAHGNASGIYSPVKRPSELEGNTLQGNTHSSAFTDAFDGFLKDESYTGSPKEADKNLLSTVGFEIYACDVGKEPVSSEEDHEYDVADKLAEKKRPVVAFSCEVIFFSIGGGDIDPFFDEEKHRAEHKAAVKAKRPLKCNCVSPSPDKKVKHPKVIYLPQVEPWFDEWGEKRQSRVDETNRFFKKSADKTKVGRVIPK